MKGVSQNAAQRFRALCSGGFRSTKLQFITKVYSKHKTPSLHVSPPDAKPVLAAVLLLFVSLSPFCQYHFKSLLIDYNVEVNVCNFF